MNNILWIGLGVAAVAWLVSQQQTTPPPSSARPGIDIALPGAGITIHVSEPNQPNAGINYSVSQY